MELINSNMQDITLSKCPTAHKKLGKSGLLLEKMSLFPLCSYTSTSPSSKFGHSLPIKFVFRVSKTWANCKFYCESKKEKSEFGKSILCCHSDRVNNTKTIYKHNFLKALRSVCILACVTEQTHEIRFVCMNIVGLFCDAGYMYTPLRKIPRSF